ncbi:MAG TPA: alpha amylase C-terminal domain-containing protein, partial [Bacteroidales bacterium]|nr:alpha amylase C-terminal domain-containing protein [Bacteroidales bacterium]
GTPEDLKYLIKKAHEQGLAVIMDLIHSHTVKNINEGLNEFDGSDDQYFHPGARGYHPHWDSKCFDYGKREVLQFLLSNVKFWLKEFHFDGFRFDGVTSMMYFDHGFRDNWDINGYFREGVEWDALVYLQLANKLTHSVYPGAITIAEDVSGMPGLCNPIQDGGIGFDFRLGMALPDFWIRILKEKTDEEWNIHEMWNVMTDRLPGVKTVAYCESHDQALVGDQTLAFRLMQSNIYFHMHKTDSDIVTDRGVSLHKVIRLMTITLGGEAYLNFMGNEFGHPDWIDFPREGNNWSFRYARRMWSLVEDTELKYHFLGAFDKAMLTMVTRYGIFRDEFARQLNMDEANKTMVFMRGGLIFILNFHPHHSIPDYAFSVPEPGEYEIVLNTDNSGFGGHGRIDEKTVFFSHPGEAKTIHTLNIYITSRTGLVLRKVR